MLRQMCRLVPPENMAQGRREKIRAAVNDVIFADVAAVIAVPSVVQARAVPARAAGRMAEERAEIQMGAMMATAVAIMAVARVVGTQAVATQAAVAAKGIFEPRSQERQSL